MKVKEGKERNEAIKQINDDEELREIAQEDPDAILLHDPEGSVITLVCGNSCYKSSEDFLVHRLKVLNGSLNKLCKELDFDTCDFFESLLLGIEDDELDELVIEAYDGESLGDLYNETV
ncbi:hypothetical protein [Lactobacillus sp.]|uniref:hypothetical protein n=1 Tax=Lactobacillus sp. TaxID=1591 RepID=UPI0025829ACA|nr:hypothetical protein [Lactobacillus sp.]MCO6529050.1 hypothetical protein [Lactobacillus sp.]